jgi:excisionase family DNA binding protein
MYLVNVVTSSTTRTSPPDLLTVEEAARVLRIGRTNAYELVRRYLATDGAEGVPARRIGRLLRVPRHALEAVVGGPITWPIPDEPAVVDQPAPVIAIDTRTRSDRRPRSRPSQPSLPLPS